MPYPKQVHRIGLTFGLGALEHQWRSMSLHGLWEEGGSPQHWRPPTDLFETEHYFLVRVEIAGMREEDFDIVYRDGTLLISGMRVEPEAPARAYHQMEIGYGHFATVLRFPVAVDVASIEASYVAGFLTIRIPKAHQSMTPRTTRYERE